MNLEEFRASKATATPQEAADKLRIEDSYFEGCAAVLIYGDAFYIIDHGEGYKHPETGEPLPRYWLILERDEYLSDDLAELEARLHEWVEEIGG